jgi:signal transduction histidine kinase
MKLTENTTFKVLLTIFLLISNTIYSQNSYFEEWYSADKEHLPQNSVKSIAPDKYGFVWMTTENGLARFDGENFKNFNNNTMELQSNRFLYLFGNIKKDALYAFTDERADFVSITKRKVNKIKKNNFNKNVLDYSDKRFYLNHQLYTKFHFLGCRIEDTNENYYLIGAKNISFYSSKHKLIKKVAHNYLPTNDYFLIHNELVCLSNSKIYSFFNSNFQTQNTLNLPSNSKTIYNHLTQQYYVCSANQIAMISKSKNKLFLTTLVKLKNDHNLISCVYYDTKNKKLFLGTQNKGLAILTLNKFTVLTNPTSTNNNYYAITALTKTEFITAKGEIYNKDGLVKDLKLNPNGNKYAITLDQQKNIWIQNDNILIRFHKATNYTTSNTYDFKTEIKTIFCDSKNKIWVGFRSTKQTKCGVATIDANKKKATPEWKFFIKDAVSFFAETKEQTILMIGKKRILFYKPNSKNVQTVSLGKNEARSIFICKDNKIWICTYNNGFSLLKDKQLIKLPFDTNQFLNSAHCINEDKKGHFWISTNRGLIEVAKSSLLQYIVAKKPVYYHHYDTEDGFLTNEFNGGCQPSTCQLENGYIIFPSLNGLVVFHPEKVNKIIPIRDFFIHEGETENETIYFNDTVYLSRKNARVKLKIDFPYYGNRNNIHFESKLMLGENSKWISTSGEKKTISFTNLPPGDHILFIRKIGGFSSNYQTKKIVLSVPYKYYEKTWFKFIIILFIIGCILIISRLRYKYIKRKNEELEQIIDERTNALIKTVEALKITKNNLSQEILQQKKLIGTISHDIKSPLKFLAITAKHLDEKASKTENETLKDNAKIMHESANQLFRFVENLVDYSKIFMEHHNINQLQKEPIEVVIYEKMDLFENIAVANGIQILYKNETAHPLLIDKKVIGIIIHNLLDNAIKNTKNGEIHISVKLEGKKLYVGVTDTGNGISEEIKNYYLNLLKNNETDKLSIQNYGIGLHMVLELVKLLNGDLKINTKKNEGTTMEIILDYI